MQKYRQHSISKITGATIRRRVASPRRDATGQVPSADVDAGHAGAVTAEGHAAAAAGIAPSAGPAEGGLGRLSPAGASTGPAEAVIAAAGGPPAATSAADREAR